MISFKTTRSLILFSLLSSAALLLQTSIAQAFTGLDADEFKALQEAWEHEPGLLANDPKTLAKLSGAQIKTLVEQKDTSHFSFLHVVNVKGEELGDSALNLNNHELSIMTVREGKLKVIPFQIDETDVNGLTYMPKTKLYKIDGKEGTLDKQDEIVFMYRDTGFERYQQDQTKLSRGTVLKEIEITFLDRKTRYAYLVHKNPSRSATSYVDIDLDKAEFNSTYFLLTWNPKNFGEVRDVVLKVGPAQTKNIVDNAYFEVSAGILNKHTRVTLDSRKNITSKISDVKAGPIRVTALLKSRAKIIGIPSPAPYYLNLVLHEQSINFKSRTSPDGYKYAKYITKILKEPKVYSSIDFHNINGAKVSFDSISQDGPAPVVDGKMSALEHKINEKRLPGDWFWIESGFGWSIFFSNNWPIIEGGLFDAFMEGMSFHMVYEDDLSKETKYERFPGGEPRIGIRGEGLPNILLEMLSATSDIEWQDIKSVEDAAAVFVEKSSSRRFKKFNQIISEVLIKEREKGTILNNTDLANAFIADFDLVGLRGVDRAKLNQAIIEGVSKLESFETFNIGNVITDVLDIAKGLGIDPSIIHYAPRDNALWLPDSLGDGGPDGFRHEVNNPPRFVINDIN